jgi:hypothetical protein
VKDSVNDVVTLSLKEVEGVGSREEVRDNVNELDSEGDVDWDADSLTDSDSERVCVEEREGVLVSLWVFEVDNDEDFDSLSETESVTD